jgi:acyl-coenzyme A synthetase/AMP-(fatty) acid ligase
VESHLNGFPSIVESMCLGVVDPQGVTGETVKAYLVCDRQVSDQELTSWLRGRLEEHEIPRIYERVTELPKTDNGKIKRQALA